MVFCLKTSSFTKIILAFHKDIKKKLEKSLIKIFLKLFSFQDTIPILCHFLSPFSSNMGTLNHTGRSWWIWKTAEFSYLDQSTLNTSCCFISEWGRKHNLCWWNTEDKPSDPGTNEWFQQKAKERSIFLKLGWTKPPTCQIGVIHKIQLQRITGFWGLVHHWRMHEMVWVV